MINFITKLDNEVALIRSFLKIDQQGDGDIDEKELKAAFREYLHLDCKTADAVSKEVIAKIDLNGSKDISYSCTVHSIQSSCWGRLTCDR